MKKILISIPISPKERIDPELMNWLIRNLIHYNFIHAGTIQLGYDVVVDKPIDNVRNKCINRFLAGDYDYILTIDSDIVPPDNCIEAFLRWEKPIVNAVSFSFQYGYPFAVILDKEAGGYVSKKLNGERLVECQATGAACMLIERKVLTEMKDYLLQTTGKTMFYETKYNEKGELSWGQDFIFCENAMAIGYKIHVDTHILTDHFSDRVNLKRVNDILVNESLKKENMEIV